MVVELALWDSLRNGGCRLSSAGGMTANVFHFHGCGTVTIRTAPSRNRNTAHVAAGADNAHAGLPGLAEAQREHALARRPRSDRGTRRMPPDLQLLIEGLALRRPPPTITTVHQQAAEVARAQGWPAPGYAAVYD